MKKIISRILIVIICLSVLAAIIMFGHLKKNKTDPVEKDIEFIRAVTDIFGDRLESLGIDEEVIEEVITGIEDFNEKTKYVITFDVQNDTNPILSTTISLPVDEAFFNSVEIGDVIAKEEIENIQEIAQLSDNFGNWIVTVQDKTIRE